MRRTRYDAMQPLSVTTWLVVQNEYSETISVRELPPQTDPRMIMIAAMARSVGKGWEVEELPGVIPTYFCRKDGKRHMVSIMRRRPDDKKTASSADRE